MTDKLLIEALERIADMRTAGGDFIEMHRHELRGIAKTALAAHRSQQEAAPEPFGWIHEDVQGVRSLKTKDARHLYSVPVGTMLYTAAPAPSESEAKDGPTEQDLAWHRAQLKLDDLIRSGAVLSNVAFNLRQRVGAVLSGQQCGFLHEAQKDWDESLREYRAALSASGQKGEPT